MVIALHANIEVLKCNLGSQLVRLLSESWTPVFRCMVSSWPPVFRLMVSSGLAARPSSRRRNFWAYQVWRTAHSSRAPPPRAYRHYAPPRHSYARYSRAYGPYFRHGYTPRYHVGGWYRPHQHTVYITDYHAYGLYAPPPGHYWVRDHHSGDAVLASVATGAIIGLVIGALAYD